MPASRHGPENLRLARRAQSQGPGTPDQSAADDLPGAGAHLRAQAGVHPADAAARDRWLLARAPAARRPARPCARGEKRHASGLDLAACRGPQERPAEELPAAARALSRERPCARRRLLLRLWPARLPARLARRPLALRTEPESELALGLCRRLEFLERPERPG